MRFNIKFNSRKKCREEVMLYSPLKTTDNYSSVRASRTEIYLLAGALQINFEIIYCYCKSTFLKGAESALKSSNSVRELVIFDKKLAQ